MLGRDIAKARNVNAVRAAPKRSAVVKTAHRARRAGAVVVIHDVAAERAAGVAEALRKVRTLGIEQQADRLDGRGAQEHHAGFVLGFLERVRIDQAYAANAPALRIVGELGGDAVRTQRQVAGGVGGGER